MCTRKGEKETRIKFLKREEGERKQTAGLASSCISGNDDDDGGNLIFVPVNEFTRMPALVKRLISFPLFAQKEDGENCEKFCNERRGCETRQRIG